MHKIPTIFVRDHATKLVTPEINPECQWVFNGEGICTRKFDGTCCMIRNGKLFKRYEVKNMYIDHEVDGIPVWMSKNDIPEDFEGASEVDPVTGRWQGWVPVSDGPEDQWHREAFIKSNVMLGDLHPDWMVWHPIPDGTYELCGPKIQGNPEKFSEHFLVKHGSFVFDLEKFDNSDLWPPSRSYVSIKNFLSKWTYEGVVFNHYDGRMGKIKRRDFGIKG